jgi:hypothetical protein
MILMICKWRDQQITVCVLVNTVKDFFFTNVLMCLPMIYFIFAGVLGFCVHSDLAVQSRVVTLSHSSLLRIRAL